MVNLTDFNTLKVPARADSILEVASLSDLANLDTSRPFMFLGEGANILFTHDFPGTIVKINLTGKTVVSESESAVLVDAAAGENWHDLVMWTAQNRWSGIENMALIPGTVGGAVTGNIAAYGQNQADVVESVRVFDLHAKQEHILTQRDCRFFYRESAFKHEFKSKYLITSVRYHLSKTAHFDTSYYSRYESLEKILHDYATPPYSPADVARAVIAIRNIKMPDWKVTPTAGSFFKNPFVTKQKLTDLQSRIKELQYYPTEKMLYPHPEDPIFAKTDMVKIPAGRLLDELGWKGRKIGHVGTFERHALVVINLGGATGQEIYDFTEAMRSDVKNNFGIELEPEVQII